MFETLVTRSFLGLSFAAIVVAWAHGFAALSAPAPVAVVVLPAVVITGSRSQASDIVAVVPSQVLQLPTQQ